MMNLSEDRVFKALCKVVRHEPRNAEEVVKRKAYIEVFKWLLSEEENDVSSFAR